MDARKLASFDIPTRESIHQYQCDNPILSSSLLFYGNNVNHIGDVIIIQTEPTRLAGFNCWKQILKYDTHYGNKKCKILICANYGRHYAFRLFILFIYFLFINLLRNSSFFLFSCFS